MEKTEVNDISTKLIERNIVKPIYFDDKGWSRCPVCHKMVGNDNFCKHCGQRLKEDG